jgi:Lipopolysaccharide-assembly
MKKLIVLMALVLTLPGCGYSLAGRGSFLPAYIQVVGIPQLINRTPYFDVEQILTEKVRTEFIGRGKYRILPDAPGADAVLTGEVLNIFVFPSGYTDAQVASRYSFTLTMKVTFTDARTNEVLWSNDALTFREEYELATRVGTNVDTAAFLDQERAAFDRIATDIGRTVVTAILEAF